MTIETVAPINCKLYDADEAPASSGDGGFF